MNIAVNVLTTQIGINLGIGYIIWFVLIQWAISGVIGAKRGENVFVNIFIQVGMGHILKGISK